MNWYFARIDAFNERPAAITSPNCGAEDTVDVDVVTGNLSRLWRRSFRMVPTDEDRLVQLPLERQLTWRWD